MTLEEIQELVEKDLQINDSELDLESIKIPQLHSKYLKLYTKFKLLLDRSREDFSGNTLQVNLIQKFMKRNHLT